MRGYNDGQSKKRRVMSLVCIGIVTSTAGSEGEHRHAATFGCSQPSLPDVHRTSKKRYIDKDKHGAGNCVVSVCF